ncbi:helix-turn-helix domain-containing protein [Burkholderia oklahomensis]|uniref:helix-turn-helix domain-containing protein n=1 Tax=Burkholderia oklahomensis TaxID=342113 RepID=UPI00264A68B3|nr:helix-turn-helix domain-containing protein [Burkholderia oklahomensis]MDN7671600.1 helix-turn-helix domain-containing protein [Burkholderia oklahomensis]
MQAGRIAEIFNLANRFRDAGADPGGDYEMLLLSAKGGAVYSSSGIPVWTQPLHERAIESVHAIFAIGEPDAADRDDEKVSDWLRCARAHVGASGGTKRLMGLANRERGDAAADDLSIDAMLSGAASSGKSRPTAAERAAFSAALAIIRHDCGDGAAHEVAECLCPAMNARPAESAFASREARASKLIRASVQQLRDNSANRISIADTAHAAAMSERNFLRRFKQEIGVTPSEFVQRVRLEHARHMLVHTDLPVDKIARRTGLGSGDRLAKLFRQHLSMSPTEYRAIERSRGSDADLACTEFVSHLSGSVS